MLTVLQILRDCIPEQIFQYISSAEKTPDHSHKSLIVNMLCGSSIIKDQARHSLLQGCVLHYLRCLSIS